MEGRKARLQRVFAVAALASAATALGFGILYDPNTRTHLQLREVATAATQKAATMPDPSKMTLEPLRTPNERARREMARRERDGIRLPGPGFQYYLDTEYDERRLEEELYERQQAAHYQQRKNDRSLDEIEVRQKALLLFLLLATRSATGA